MILFLLACETVFSPPVAPPAGPTVPTLLGQAPGVAFVGHWTSTGCGQRQYARNISFELDNTYNAIDMISPCRPGTQCIWSGMVGYSGSWAQPEEKRLVLREWGSSSAPGSPHPQEFFADDNGNLVESNCVYTRGFTVPEGMTEAQVTPQAAVPTVTPAAPPAVTPP